MNSNEIAEPVAWRVAGGGGVTQNKEIAEYLESRGHQVKPLFEQVQPAKVPEGYALVPQKCIPRLATHACKDCGAFWQKDKQFSMLWSNVAGPCCDTFEQREHLLPLTTTPATQPAKVPEWQRGQDDSGWPRVGHKYLIKLNGALQEEIFEFDCGDEGGGFWGREDLDECPSFNPLCDEWLPLSALTAAPAAEEPRPYWMDHDDNDPLPAAGEGEES